MFFKEVLVVVRARVAAEVAEFCPNLEFFNLRFQEFLTDASCTSPEQCWVDLRPETSGTKGLRYHNGGHYRVSGDADGDKKCDYCGNPKPADCVEGWNRG